MGTVNYQITSNALNEKKLPIEASSTPSLMERAGITNRIIWRRLGGEVK